MRSRASRSHEQDQCRLAEAWDEGRAAAILEMKNAIEDLWGPQPSPTPNPYRTVQEIENGDVPD